MRQPPGKDKGHKKRMARADLGDRAFGPRFVGDKRNIIYHGAKVLHVHTATAFFLLVLELGSNVLCTAYAYRAPHYSTHSSLSILLTTQLTFPKNLDVYRISPLGA